MELPLLGCCAREDCGYNWQEVGRVGQHGEKAACLNTDFSESEIVAGLEASGKNKSAGLEEFQAEYNTFATR